MWPFRKKPVLPPPDDVIVGNDRATYDPQTDQWEWVLEGVEFTLSGRDFDPAAFQWARTGLKDIQQLQPTLEDRVLEQLKGWPCNPATQRLLCVSLDDYASDHELDLAYVGDESWGDYGVNVILVDGNIVDVHGGD